MRISVDALGRQEAPPGIFHATFTITRGSLLIFFTTTPFGMNQAVINIGIDKEKMALKFLPFRGFARIFQ